MRRDYCGQISDLNVDIGNLERCDASKDVFEKLLRIIATRTSKDV